MLALPDDAGGIPRTRQAPRTGNNISHLPPPTARLPW